MLTMNKVEYIQIKARGMTFGRHRKHGDFEFNSIYPIGELPDIDSASMNKWLENGSLVAKTEIEYNSFKGIKEVEMKVETAIENAEVVLKTKPEVVEKEDEEVEEEEELPVIEQSLRGGKTKDEFWADAHKVSVRKRKCAECEKVYSNRQDLFECCVVETD